MTDTLFALDGDVALVTGASSGLGAHFARTLHAAGARVVLAARRMQRLEALADELGPTRAMPVAMDVCDSDSIEAALDATTKAFGTPQILVNNAGVAITERFLDIKPQSWDKTLDVNLTGVFRVAQATAQRMAQSGRGGRIINIASVLGLVVQPTQAAYASTKAGVIHLTRSMALELAREKIRVNAIAPGYFVTEINEAFFNSEAGEALARRLVPRRTGELHELDGPLLLLASEASSYMTGTTLAVDGGTMLAGA